MNAAFWEYWLSLILLSALACFYVLLGWRVLASYRQNHYWPWSLRPATALEARARMVLWIGYLGAHFFWLAYVAMPYFIQIVFIPVFPWHWYLLRLSGGIVTALVVLLWFIIALQMGPHWHIGIRVTPPPVYRIQDGSFAFFPHPLYLCLGIATATSFLVIPIWPFLLCVIICVYGWYLQACSETEFLRIHLLADS